MVVVDRGYSEEHEDDGLRRRGQHLHGILDGRVRFERDVCFYVVFHCYTAKGYSGIMTGLSTLAQLLRKAS